MDPDAASGDLPAGAFAAWLADTDDALAGERDADVPCDDCTACCRSSQFVHVGPDEHDALAHIPAALLFPAPGRPGHRLLGYDEQGRCPMLVDDRCSIYQHRPRTCRTYDCRVFAAAGVDPEPSQPLIVARSRRWRFEHPTADDRQRHEAVRAAAQRLAGEVTTATQRAVLAIEQRIEDRDLEPRGDRPKG